MVASLTPEPAPRHTWDVPLLGIPTRFESNAPAVIAIARDALGAWLDGPTPTAATAAPVVIRIEVEEDGPSDRGGHVRLRYHTEDRRVTITGRGVHAIADYGLRQAHARVSPAVADDAEHFRYGILEALALFIVSNLDRQPVHAAGIARGDAVVLLAGPAGVGKSTLTYAALRAGYRVFADDIVWLQQRPEPRVWGLARRLHLPADAGRHFPELVGRPAALVAAGEPKIVVSVEAHQRRATPCAATVGVCLIERTPGAVATLRPVGPEAVRRGLAPTEPGFLLFADTIGPALAAVVAAGGWRLTASSRPEEAIPLLDEVLTAVAARTA